MLQTMRNLSKSWVFKGLMILLVVSFGIWGIGDMFRGNPAQREVARVGKISIPVQLLEAKFQAELPQARKVFGPDLTATQARQIGVLERTLKVLMDALSFDQEAHRLGVDVSDQLVLQRLASMPQFRDKEGKFNAQLFQQLLRQGGMTEKYFVDNERKESARRAVFNAVVSNAHPSQLLTDNLYRARGAKRLLEVVSLRNDSIKSIKPADEATLKTYYEEHENDFIAPEYRGITVAILDGSSVGKNMTISDEDLRAAYEARSKDLQLPETRDLVQVVLQDEAKAKDLAAASENVGKLEDLAKGKGLTPIAMNKVDEKAILPELYTTIFGMDEGQISPAIKSSLGWHVVQVKKIHEGGKPPFEKIKDELAKTMAEERAGDMLARMVNLMDDQLAGGTSLEDIADAQKLRLVRYPALDIMGNDPSNKEIKDIPFKESVLKTAFSLNAGETGQILDDGKGNYFVVRADQVTSSQIRPFNEVKDEVATAWMAEQQAVQAKTAIEEIAKDIREGKSATSFASRPGVEVRLSKPISMLGDMDKEIPHALSGQIFKMKKGDVITGLVPGKSIALRMADIVPVDPAKPEASRLKIVEDLEDKFKYDLLQQYADRLETLFPTKVNNEMLQDLKNRGTE